MYKGEPVLDLDYDEDSNAQSDMNIVMNDKGDFIEVQGTAEKRTFSRDKLNQLLDLADKGIKELFIIQKEA
jgi:ribonuclease PH